MSGSGFSKMKSGERARLIVDAIDDELKRVFCCSIGILRETMLSVIDKNVEKLEIEAFHCGAESALLQAAESFEENAPEGAGSKIGFALRAMARVERDLAETAMGEEKDGA